MSGLQKRLSSLRENKRLFQKDISEENNISLRTYQSYERGEREPTIDTLIKLADYYDVSLDYLIGRSDVKQRR